MIKLAAICIQSPTFTPICYYVAFVRAGGWQMKKWLSLDKVIAAGFRA